MRRQLNWSEIFQDWTFVVHVNSLRCLKQVLRDSPMVNFVSQTMNKHIKMRLWSSAAKLAWKRKMLRDVTGGHQAYIQRKIYLWSLEFRSWLRAVSRLRSRFARDKIIKSLRSEWRSPAIAFKGNFLLTDRGLSGQRKRQDRLPAEQTSGEL